MAKSSTQSRGKKHIFSRLIKLLILTFCFCYAVSPAFTLHKVYNTASLVTSYVKDKMHSKKPKSVTTESGGADIAESADLNTANPSAAATTDATPADAASADVASADAAPSDAPSIDASASSLGEYEVTGTTELALRKAPTTDSEQIATMHQSGQNQGERIIRLNPPEGQQSEYFYYVLFTDSTGNEIQGWAGNKYLSPIG